MFLETVVVVIHDRGVNSSDNNWMHSHVKLPDSKPSITLQTRTQICTFQYNNFIYFMKSLAQNDVSLLPIFARIENFTKGEVHERTRSEEKGGGRVVVVVRAASSAG